MSQQVAIVKGNGFAPIPPERDASGQTAQEWAEVFFEYEYCGECLGDISEHDFVIGPWGGWFALCQHENALELRRAREAQESNHAG
jgi:hypothetical protein